MTPSRILGGRYEVGELIGRGGMADVHLGHDTRLGRQVAIKMLRSDLARDTNFLMRFRREAQSAAGLNHPSIVAIFDSGEDESGIDPATGARATVPYIVMEYVEGQTLRQYLTARGQLDPRDAIRITEGILDALAYSHRMGIVHRDMKPANVMITASGGVKVMDFGIARAIADTAATMTQTQSVVGTAQYLSPEQAQGQTVDARSDLYSTGCLLFELLTGRPPFMGDSPVAIAYQHVGELPQPPSIFNDAVAGDLDAVTLHALTKDRDLRYQTADAFRADLENIRLGRQISAAALGTAAAIGAAATQTLPASYAVAGTPTAVQPPITSRSERYGNTAGLPPVGHDEDEDDGRRGNGARTALITIAILALLGLIGWGAVTWFGNQAPQTVTVSVPSLKGKTEAEAAQLLANAQLQGQSTKAASTDVPAGQVIDQDPTAGTQVAVQSTVKYRVSTGAGSVAIPDVTNFPQDQARAELEKAGLVVAQIVTEDTPDRDKDRVTKTDPPANTTVDKGSSVRILVASGKVKVPTDLVGQDWVLAASSLKDQRLKAKKITVTTADAAPDTVLEVAKAGEVVDFGTTIEVKVAAAPAPAPSTVTLTPTVTDSTPAPTSTSSPGGG
ncbi:Stk1 family PASTA domain-containing Ser/Thr kinase [Intrasporangium oryzae]|uniref:Stk1 family PASTA domain-containing Ser/Thr kinase n=1 Tax=Intrasporangium oryzae TaxID=412687 RepID=UPI0004AD8BFA|nr:Stk1 family PASTA domain-containing Ser/Thr kinase [Intrasporangium oryzae]